MEARCPPRVWDPKGKNGATRSVGGANSAACERDRTGCGRGGNGLEDHAWLSRLISITESEKLPGS